MKKLVWALALAGCTVIAVNSAQAATKICRAEKEAKNNAAKSLRAKQKAYTRIERLKDRAETKVTKATEKWNLKIMNVESSAIAVSSAMSSCNIVGGILTTLWDDTKTTSFTCQGSNFLNNVVGNILDQFLGGIFGGGESCPSCAARCRAISQGLCARTVKLRGLQNGYKKTKRAQVGDNDSDMTDGSYGIQVKRHTENLAKADIAQNEAQTASDNAEAAYEACLACPAKDCTTPAAG